MEEPIKEQTEIEKLQQKINDLEERLNKRGLKDKQINELAEKLEKLYSELEAKNNATIPTKKIEEKNFFDD